MKLGDGSSNSTQLFTIKYSCLYFVHFYNKWSIIQKHFYLPYSNYCLLSLFDRSNRQQRRDLVKYLKRIRSEKLQIPLPSSPFFRNLTHTSRDIFQCFLHSIEAVENTRSDNRKRREEIPECEEMERDKLCRI